MQGARGVWGLQNTAHGGDGCAHGGAVFPAVAVRQRVIGVFSGADCFACARACEAWAAGCPLTEIISCGYVLRAASPAGRLASRVAARARLRENWALTKAVWQRTVTGQIQVALDFLSVVVHLQQLRVSHGPAEASGHRR